MRTILFSSQTYDRDSLPPRYDPRVSSCTFNRRD